MAKSLTVRGNTDLVVSNPAVQRLSRRLRWTPERAIIRIQRALPSVLEQKIYLALASDFGILPESMAKLLRFYLGEQELQLEDLEPHIAGPNMVTSKFSTFAEFLRECLNLLKIVTKEFDSFSLNIEYAAMIVTHYGTHEPERLIEMVDSSLEELCEFLGVSNEHTYSHRMRLCIWLMMTKVIPENRNQGIPDLLDISDFLTVSSGRRRQMRQLISEEFSDDFSGSQEDLRRLLKEEGIY